MKLWNSVEHVERIAQQRLDKFAHAMQNIEKALGIEPLCILDPLDWGAELVKKIKELKQEEE